MPPSGEQASLQQGGNVIDALDLMLVADEDVRKKPRGLWAVVGTQGFNLGYIELGTGFKTLILPKWPLYHTERV